MTVFALEHFGTPSSSRDARALDYAESRAVDELSGRTVWCVTALSASHDSAQTLRACLDWIGEGGVGVAGFDVAADEPLRLLTERLDEMLRGAAPAEVRLGRSEQGLYAEGVGESETMVEAGVQAGDVVVMYDPLADLLAEAVRERGAHAVWHVEVGSPEAAVIDARLFLRDYTSPVDAYVTTWREPTARGHPIERIAALMPSAGVVAAKDVDPTRDPAVDHYHHVGWSSVLADVVGADRDETVGGTIHPRPAVAPR